MRYGISLVLISIAVLLLLGCASASENFPPENNPVPVATTTATTNPPPYVPPEVQMFRLQAGLEPFTNAEYDTAQDLCQQLPINPDYQKVFRQASETEQAAVLLDMEPVCPDVVRQTIVLDQ